MRGRSRAKTREDPVDPDELQLMDEYNRAWVEAWNEAIACTDVIKVVPPSRIAIRK